ncbi:unnamed protein product [Pleuronectes platessa]|uniref:Uncharacterized protein n=1 Tax=Pleuronectes platessa TaxID=8262 RepID=A0A9N7TIX4_PLEPL|nr:unnamed protein product [Pleuronectes platessa]
MSSIFIGVEVGGLQRLRLCSWVASRLQVYIGLSRDSRRPQTDAVARAVWSAPQPGRSETNTLLSVCFNLRRGAEGNTAGPGEVKCAAPRRGLAAASSVPITAIPSDVTLPVALLLLIIAAHERCHSDTRERQLKRRRGTELPGAISPH